MLSGLIAFAFIFSSVLTPGVTYAQVLPASVLNLPAPGTMVTPSAGFNPPIIDGITIHPSDPFKFDFLVDHGDADLQGESFEAEANRLINYFLAALTVPEDELWVNLSPYESGRIIPESLSVTEMGRDMLIQDYLLKQLTASLMYPEDDLGKKFWDKVHDKARKQYGVMELPVDTFNKVWIVPENATVYETENSAIVTGSHLKVMLESDYVAMKEGLGSRVQDSKSGLNPNPSTLTPNAELSDQMIREIIVPAIEKEVNEGETFANLRQIYNSMILATWYKQNLRDSLLGQVYVNQNKVKGIDHVATELKEDVYKQYLEAFNTGVYNYIKEDFDPTTSQIVPRKYFAGGLSQVETVEPGRLSAAIERSENDTRISVDLRDESSSPVRSHAEERRFRESARTAIQSEMSVMLINENDPFSRLGLNMAGVDRIVSTLEDEYGFRISIPIGMRLDETPAIDQLVELMKNAKLKPKSITDGNELAQNAELLGYRPGASSPVERTEEEIIEIIAKQLKVAPERVTADASFRRDFGAHISDVYHIMLGVELYLMDERVGMTLAHIDSLADILNYLNRKQLVITAAQMVPSDGGIMAADESVGSAAQRLGMVSLENTYENRELMRNLMLTTDGIEHSGVSAVILNFDTFDNVVLGTDELLVDNLIARGIAPGIKTDKKLLPDPDSEGETIPNPVGLEELPEMLRAHKAKGAVFTKWRTTQAINTDSKFPTNSNIRKNAVVQAQQSRMTQEAGLVPIFEPEVLLKGTHDIAASYDATVRTLEITFEELEKEGVWLPGAILKTSMILSGDKAANRANPDEVGFQTLKGLLRSVPAALPAVVFLSGGQADDEVNRNLNGVILASQNRFREARDEAVVELRAEGKNERAEEVADLTQAPWQISYSFGRGLQRPALEAWGGTQEGYANGQQVMLRTAKEVQAARLGQFDASSPVETVSTVEELGAIIAAGILDRFPLSASTDRAKIITDKINNFLAKKASSLIKRQERIDTVVGATMTDTSSDTEITIPINIALTIFDGRIIVGLTSDDADKVQGIPGNFSLEPVGDLALAMASGAASPVEGESDEGIYGANSPAANEDEVGGIDFDAGHLNLMVERDGNGIPLPVYLQPVDVINIQGLVPVIINVAPVNMPLIFGALYDENAPLADTSQDHSLDSARNEYFDNTYSEINIAVN